MYTILQYLNKLSAGPTCVLLEGYCWNEMIAGLSSVACGLCAGGRGFLCDGPIRYIRLAFDFDGFCSASLSRMWLKVASLRNGESPGKLPNPRLPAYPIGCKTQQGQPGKENQPSTKEGQHAPSPQDSIYCVSKNAYKKARMGLN
ncbi:hypothetical protein AVEN_145460-1 [Araneus ventricosus]|uniref:Uncharacterized protein n=1 Tax=Araneus ventricosus TaxID=182803 RepID=A0A4Y2QE75_ARAVE|nr:hypothetical protein AVEN_145460-1 [Araneus ventricosus]